LWLLVVADDERPTPTQNLGLSGSPMAFGQVLPQVMATGLLGNYSLGQTPSRTVLGPHMCHPSGQERSGAATCPDHHGWDPDPHKYHPNP
jgi:hypothetical protein